MKLLVNNYQLIPTSTLPTGVRYEWIRPIDLGSPNYGIYSLAGAELEGQIRELGHEIILISCNPYLQVFISPSSSSKLQYGHLTMLIAPFQTITLPSLNTHSTSSLSSVPRGFLIFLGIVVLVLCNYSPL